MAWLASLLAIDGSTARLPNTDDARATFGAPPEGNSIPLARFSRQVGERVLAGEHLAATRANDLILYDHGYPAFWLFALHHQEQRRFCARMLLALLPRGQRLCGQRQKQ